MLRNKQASSHTQYTAHCSFVCFQVSNIHRSGCSCLVTSKDGKYLVTAGDKVLKVWDYCMRLDINFQVCQLSWGGIDAWLEHWGVWGTKSDWLMDARPVVGASVDAVGPIRSQLQA